jgi:hypothetical protein
MVSTESPSMDIVATFGLIQICEFVEILIQMFSLKSQSQMTSYDDK